MRCVSGCIVLGAALTFGGCKKDETPPEPTPIPVKVESVASQEIRPVWRYSGEVRPDKEVQLAFKQSGYVVLLHRVRGPGRIIRDVQVGDEVPAGTVLAQIRRSDNQAALTQAVGQQTSSEGTLEASRSQVDQAKADQTKAQQDFQRAKELYAVKAMTRPDYDSAEANYKTATAKVDESLRTVKTREGQLVTSKGQVDTAQINLNDTSLLTPMPALITEKLVEPGTLVSSGTVGFKVADARVVKLQFGVPDNMLSKFRIGGALPLEVDPLRGREFKGIVTQIAASANQDSRSFDIQVSVPNRDRALKVGMIASVRVEQQSDVQVVPIVPVTALSTAQSGSTNFSVFIVRSENGKQYAKLRNVRIGETIGRSVAITEGLTPGERIIVNRPNQLTDGGLIQATN